MNNSTIPSGIITEAWRASSGGIIAIVVFGAFINLLKFAMPMYTLQILDRIPDSRSVDSLLMLTLIALLAVLSGVSLESIRRRMLVSWSGWIKRYFGPSLVQAGISGSEVNNHQGPTRSLDNLQTIRSFIEKSAASILDVVWVPAFVAVVFTIHPLFGSIMLLAMALRLLSGYVQNQLTRPSRQQWSIASRRARGLVEEAERNGDTIGAVSMAYRLSQRWLDSIKTKLSEREQSHTHGSLFAAINTGLYRSLYVAGMGFGVWLVIQDTLTIGGVIAVNIIMRFGFRIMDRGVRRWESFNKARRAYRRLVMQFVRLPLQQQRPILTKLNQALIIEGLAHRYPRHKSSVLRRVNLRIEPGEMLCVIGRSASGKSTFARLMSGLLKPRRGQVRLGDMDMSAIAADQRHPIVGYLNDEARLFAGTIGDNISALQGGDQTTLIDAAQLAGIHERIEQLPKGYDTHIDDRTALLSSGERRRLLLARAFYGRPHLVVLDEPAAHLDRPGRDRLIEAINALKASGSIIIVTSQSNRLGQIAEQTYMLGRSRMRPRARPQDKAQSAQVEALQSLIQTSLSERTA